MTLISRPSYVPEWGALHPTTADRAAVSSGDFSAGFLYGAGAPTRQFFNGIWHDFHVRGLYHLQGGAPEFSTDTDYRPGALVTFNALTYRAPATVAAGGAVPDGNYPAWVLCGNVTSALYCAELSSPIGTAIVLPTFPNKRLVRIVACGGGGGGGGSIGYSGPGYCGGASGGGAALASELWLVCNPTDVLTLTLGAKGLGAAGAWPGPTVGSTGGDTYVQWLDSQSSYFSRTYAFKGGSGGVSGQGNTTSALVRRSGGSPQTMSGALLMPVMTIDDTGANPTWLSTTPLPPGAGGWSGLGATATAPTWRPQGRCGGHGGANRGGLVGQDYAGAYTEACGGGGGTSDFPLGAYRADPTVGSTVFGGGTGGAGGNLTHAAGAGSHGFGPGMGGGGGGGSLDCSGAVTMTATGGDGTPGAVWLQMWECQ